MGDVGSLGARRRARHRRAADQAGAAAGRSSAASSCMEALSVIIQVASFKLTGQRVFKMAPLHHHFELIGWSEPKVITRFVIVGDHLRAVQPDDAEAAMTKAPSASPSRQAGHRRRRGAQRCRRRGAAGPARRAGHADRRARRDRRRRTAARRRRRRWSSAEHREATLRGADLIVAEPGRAAAAAGARGGARRPGCRVVGELELASRWLRGRVVAITGTKGKSTTTDAGRAGCSKRRGCRVLVGGNIGVALSAQVDDSTEDTIHVIEASSFQLESDRHVRAVDCRAAQLLAGSSRPPCRRRGIRRRQGADLRATSGRTTGRC